MRVNHSMLQWLTNCLTPWIIDRAVGDMKLDSQAGPEVGPTPATTSSFDKDWLSSELERSSSPRTRSFEIAAIDNPANMDDLAKLGATAAARQVKEEHLPAAFDLV